MRTRRPLFFIPLLLLLLLGCATRLPAQHNSLVSNLKSAENRANDLYSKGAYAQAAGWYQLVVQKETENVQALFRLADSYARINEAEQALIWYANAFRLQPSPEPAHLLGYAQALASAGRYADAKSWYQRYLTAVPRDRRASLQLDALANPQRFYADSASYQIKRLKINSPQSDFGPAFYKEGIVFVSGREVKKPLKWVNATDQGAFLDLYYGKTDPEGELADAGKLPHPLSSRFHEGPVAFFEGGKRIIFSQNVAPGSTARGAARKLALFEAHLSSDGRCWTNITPLPFNNAAYSVAHPSLNATGDVLYFASDMPGGYGQSDIYVSRRENGRWSAPQNLGPTVNTEGNELFPYLHHNTLYFASNGLGGLGGLDVFKLELGQVPGRAQNLGAPINSPKDDFGLILNADNTGYFSTNRLKDSKDDLYWFRHTPGASPPAATPLLAVQQHSVLLKGVLHEKESRQLLAGASVYILNQQTGEELNLLSDEKGEFSFDARLEDLYAIMAERGDFNVFVVNISASEYPGPERLIELEANSLKAPEKLYIEASLYDSLNRQPVAFAGAFLYEGQLERGMDFTAQDGKIYFTATKGKAYTLEIFSVTYAEKQVLLPAGQLLQQDTIKLAIPLQKLPTAKQLARGYLYHHEQNTPLAGAEVYVLNEVSGEQQLLMSDAQGGFLFEANTTDTYLFMAEKGNLHAFLTDVLVRDPQKFPEDVVKLPASSPQFTKELVLEALVMDKATAAPLRFAEITFATKTNSSKGYTGSAGKAYFSYTGSEPLSLRVKLKDFEDYIQDIPATTLSRTDTLRLSLPLEKSIPEYQLARGFVFDKASGAPEEEATIYLLNDKNGEEETLKSNADGFFEFRAYAGASYLIMAEKNMKRLFLQDHRLSPSEDTGSPWLRLPLEAPHFEPGMAAQVLLLAQVVDSESKDPIKFTFYKLFEGTHLVDNAFADEQGSVMVLLDKNKEYRLQLDKPQWAEEIFTISTHQQADTLALKLELRKQTPETVVVAGRVYDLGAGAPLANADIFVLDTQTGTQSQLQADENGNFEFPFINSHTYTLLGEKSGKVASLTDVKPAAFAASKTLQLLVQPPKSEEAIILTTVLDAKTGQTIKAASLILLEQEKEVHRTHTSFKGMALLSAQANREFLLQVSASQYGAQSLSISASQLQQQDTLRLSVSLTPSEPLMVQQQGGVYQTDGTPVAGARIHLINKKSGEEKQLLTDARGTFSYAALVGEPFTLMVEKGDLKALLPLVESREEQEPLRIEVVSPSRNDVFVRLRAKEKDSQEPVKFLELQLTQDQQQATSLFTSLKGETGLLLAAGSRISIKTAHINYREAVQSLVVPQQQDTLVVDILLEKLPTAYTTLRILALDAQSNQPLPHAEVVVINEATGEEKVYLANERGELPLKAGITDSFTLRTQSPAYSATPLHGIRPADAAEAASSEIQFRITAKVAERKALALGGQLSLIEVSSGEKQFFVAANGLLYEYRQTGDSLILKNTKSLLVLEANTRQGAAPGEVLLNYLHADSIAFSTQIRTIYYDFDQAGLNEGAKEELRKLADLMQRYPELLIRINAFTDSRGPATYNLTLSSRRAAAASAYLISLGIDRSRIRAEGLGESKLLIPCPKPADCRPDQHQLNRRGEFILNLQQ